MEKLQQISEVLALQRSQRERDVLVLKGDLAVLENEISIISVQVSQKMKASAASFENERQVSHIVQFEKWKALMGRKLRSLEEQRATVLIQYDKAKISLKEVIVNQGLINTQVWRLREQAIRDLSEDNANRRLEVWTLFKTRG